MLPGATARRKVKSRIAFRRFPLRAGIVNRGFTGRAAGWDSHPRYEAGGAAPPAPLHSPIPASRL